MPPSTNTTCSPGKRSKTPPKVSWRPVLAEALHLGQHEDAGRARRGRRDRLADVEAERQAARLDRRPQRVHAWAWLYWMVSPSTSLPGLIGTIRQRAPSSTQRSTDALAAAQVPVVGHHHRIAAGPCPAAQTSAMCSL